MENYAPRVVFKVYAEVRILLGELINAQQSTVLNHDYKMHLIFYI